MKGLLLFSVLLCLTAVSGADTVIVRDRQTGEHKSYAVEQQNGNLTVYDYDEGTYRHMTIDSDGTVWDWQENKYYHVSTDAKARSGAVIDAETGKTYYFSR